jgi:hypothetical protein
MGDREQALRRQAIEGQLICARCDRRSIKRIALARLPGNLARLPENMGTAHLRAI